MLNTDGDVVSYYALHPTDFHDLECLEICQSDVNGNSEATLKIELRPKNGTDTRRLILMFSGVRNLKYITDSFSVLYFSFLEIVSVEDRQWEGINYQVFESEQDSDFSFYCREFRTYFREAGSQK